MAGTRRRNVVGIERAKQAATPTLLAPPGLHSETVLVQLGKRQSLALAFFGVGEAPPISASFYVDMPREVRLSAGGVSAEACCAD